MANAWDNVTMIAAEALTVLHDELVIARLCSVDKTADFMVRPNGYAVGSTVNIKTRPAYTAEEFSSSITVQDIKSSIRSMSIEKHYDVSVQVGAKEKKLNMDGFSEEVIRPAVTVLAEQVDTYVGTKIINGAGMYASDTLLESASDVALARKAAIVQQLEKQGRFAILDLDLEATVLGQTWFNQSQTRGVDGTDSLREGEMGRVMGINWFSSINFATTAQSAGTMVCLTNNGAGGNTNNRIGDTSLVVDNQTASQTLTTGDRISIAGVRRPLVVNQTIADTSATTTIALVDEISEIIPDNAAVTVIGSGQSLSIQGAIFDTPALGIAMPMLDPASDKPSAVLSYEGISIRVVQGYDMTTKKETMSLDLLVGAEAYDPRRITLLSSY